MKCNYGKYHNGCCEEYQLDTIPDYVDLSSPPTISYFRCKICKCKLGEIPSQTQKRMHRWRGIE